MVMWDLELLARASQEETLRRAERRRLVEEARRAAHRRGSSPGAARSQACPLHTAGGAVSRIGRRLRLGDTARWRRRLAIGPA